MKEVYCNNYIYENKNTLTYINETAFIELYMQRVCSLVVVRDLRRDFIAYLPRMGTR